MKKGTLLKYKTPIDGKESGLMLEVLEDRGERVLVCQHESGLPFPPSFNVLKSVVCAPATLETYLPVFPGFYGSSFEIWGEREKEELVSLFGDHPYAEKLAEYCAGERSLCDVDYSSYYYEYAKKLCESVSFALSECESLKGFEKLEFQTLKSPKEYNFQNDSVDVRVVLSDERAFRASLLRLIRSNRKAFDAYIKRLYTSRSGFMSWYSADGTEWVSDIRRGILELDGHKAGRLLDWVLSLEDFTDESLYYSCEAPYIGEFMTGPLVDFANGSGKDGPEFAQRLDDCSELFDAIEQGEKQFSLYRSAMVGRDESILKAYRDLQAYTEKLYKEIKDILVNGKEG